MKQQLKLQISQLVASIIFIIGLIALAVLAMARSAGSMAPKSFFICFTMASGILLLARQYINQNFIDGEWIQRGGTEVNHEAITIDDCLDMFEKKGQATVINDGQVVGFVREKYRSIP